MKEAREEHQHRTISKVSRKVAVTPSLLPTKQPSARREAIEQMVWSLDASGNAYQVSPAQLAKKKLQNIQFLYKLLRILDYFQLSTNFNK